MYYSTSTMWVDVLTKGLLGPKHIECIKTIGLGKLEMWQVGMLKYNSCDQTWVIIKLLIPIILGL